MDGTYNFLEEVSTSLTMIHTLIGNIDGSRIGYFDSSDNFIECADGQENKSYAVSSSIQVFG